MDAISKWQRTSRWTELQFKGENEFVPIFSTSVEDHRAKHSTVSRLLMRTISFWFKGERSDKNTKTKNRSNGPREPRLLKEKVL